MLKKPSFFRLFGSDTGSASPLLPAQRVDPVSGLPAARPLCHPYGGGPATGRPTAAADPGRPAGGPLRYTTPAGNTMPVISCFAVLLNIILAV